MIRKMFFPAILAILALAMSAYAHHSIEATYDTGKEVKLEGKLIQFLFRNPHSFVHIEVTDENGKMQRYAVEWGGAGALSAQGVKGDTFKFGDIVVIGGNPARHPEDHRVNLNALRRPKDGFRWGALSGVVD